MNENKSIHFEKIKKTFEGRCAICGKLSKLTYDHIPPRGCGNAGTVIISEYLKGNSKTISQNGTKRRSICSFCNNTLLGTQYDPSLISLVKQITQAVSYRENSSLYWSDKIKVSVDILCLTKSVIGHILACDFADTYPVDYIKKPYYGSMIDFVLDKEKRALDNYEIYYWYYPYGQQKMLRHFAIAQFLHGNALLSASKPIQGHILKFFPIAFWAVYQKPKEHKINLCKINLPNCPLEIINNEIELDIKTPLPETFPENPQDDCIALFNSHYAQISDKILQKDIRGQNG